MQRVRDLIHVSSRVQCPVLILGETGTGKELVARAIHDLGSRRNRPFVPIDCAALAPSLIESELFGHTAGAFTGALCNRTGLFESAHGGSVFLDEIGELPPSLQPRLLRVLQEREIRPVGSNQCKRIDIRLIAATNQDLQTSVKNNGFRADLFFRLNVVRIDVPPLRERKPDIPLLIEFFLDKFKDSRNSAGSFSETALARLMEYDWPGNVRELENAVEHAVVFSDGPKWEVSALPHLVRAPGRAQNESREPMTWHEREKRAIYRAIEEAQGNRRTAAQILGIGKTTLYRKLQEYEREDGSRLRSAQASEPEDPGRSPGTGG